MVRQWSSGECPAILHLTAVSHSPHGSSLLGARVLDAVGLIDDHRSEGDGVKKSRMKLTSSGGDAVLTVSWVAVAATLQADRSVRCQSREVAQRLIVHDDDGIIVVYGILDDLLSVDGTTLHHIGCVVRPPVRLDLPGSLDGVGADDE